MKAVLVSLRPILLTQQHTFSSEFEPGYPRETTSKGPLPEQFFRMLGTWLPMTMLCMKGIVEGFALPYFHLSLFTHGGHRLRHQHR